MNYKECKEGIIYYCDYFDNKDYIYIVRMVEEHVGCSHIREKEKQYWHQSGHFNEQRSVYREAIQQEKEHFEQCEKAGRYVEYKPEIIQSLIFN